MKSIWWSGRRGGRRSGRGLLAAGMLGSVMSLVLALLLGSGMVLAMSAAPSASARQTLERVTLAHGLCEQSHPESAIRLPDDWAQHDISAPDIACYRAHLQLDRLPDHTWALRIDRLP